MDIVRAKPADAGILTRVALSAKRFWNYPECWIAEWTPLLTISPQYIEDNEVYALTVAQEIVGFYALTGNGPRLSLDHLWLAPAAIGKGYGRALMEHAVNRARQLGATALEIEADPNAQGFYERMGARKVGDRATEVQGQPRLLPVLLLEI
jgi:GNAT superfamily N-acetyltransferase